MGYGISFKVTKDTEGRGLNALKDIIENVDKKIVKVGLPDSSHDDTNLTLAQIGAIHEYGAPSAGIPERPFLAASIRSNTSDLRRLNTVNVKLILHGRKTVEGALGQMGEMAKGMVQKYISEDNFVPLQPATIAAKGSSRPLVDTGQMRQSVSYVVEDK
jgi:hypothetical protein